MQRQPFAFAGTVAVCVLIGLVGCQQAERTAPASGIRVQNEFYALNVPDAYEVRCENARCNLRHKQAYYAVALVPVELQPGDTPEKVLAAVEPMHLQSTPEREVVRHWRGEFPIAGAERPALYVVQRLRRDGRQLEVINSHVPREGWLLGVTIIGEGVHGVHRGEIEALLRQIEFRR
ncbi:MAG: hypothetical protein RMK45_10920 [Armatimonadota bacterium]|nr:hypothetical protein [Armatimonadota bacterium]